MMWLNWDKRMNSNVELTEQELHDNPGLAAMAFGDPESAIKRHPALELFTARQANEGDYYVPSIPFRELALLRRVNSQHGPLPSFKADWIGRYMLPNKLISRKTLVNAAIDHETIANGTLRLERNKAQGVLAVHYEPMINIRRGTKPGEYGRLREGRYTPFYAGEIVHVMEHETIQQIYGIPYWIGAMHSILLGEEVRLFPRKFFKNGAHAGNIIVTAGQAKPVRKLINDALNGVKGFGALKSIVLHLGFRGKIDEAFKVVSLSEHAYRIDYSKLAAMCATDVLEAWRIRPELAGQMPENMGGSGDLEKIREMYHQNEMVPRMQLWADALNEHLPPRHRLKFMDYGDTVKAKKSDLENKTIAD